MKKWFIIKNLEVEKLVFGWKWFSKLKSDNKDIDWKTIFITGWAIPFSIVDVKIIKKRKDYLMTQIVNIVKKSSLEKKHPNNPYWECWGCKWINIPYKEQLKIKYTQVKESFFHLEKIIWNIDNSILPIIPSPLIDWYRNKVEFSFWKMISSQNNIEQHFNVWFHKQGMFSQIEDFDWCILIDKIQNEIYKEIKDFCKKSWLPVYDQKPQTWFYRHIVIRRAFFTDEIMIILWFNHKYFKNEDLLKEKIVLIKNFIKRLWEKYNIIKSFYLSYNDNKADIAIWELELVYWDKLITEKLRVNNSSLFFKISPKSFFQTNSYWAEVLYSKVLDFADKNLFKWSIVLDLYAWTWTIWMIFAKNFAKKVYSVELVKSSSDNWKENAKLNNLNNLEFINKKVEDFLEYYTNQNRKADFLIIDPPRSWMHPKALPNILKFKAKQIIYVSCNPSTLTRDLNFIFKNSDYKIDKIVAIDMFPHTHHIEIIVSLKLNKI